MARCLIVPCGCRGLALGVDLRARGHAVRGTTRDPARIQRLRAAGVEAVLGDPDRVATLAGAFAHVGVVCLLLGTVTGDRARLEALFGTRLEMLVTRMLDTTVRGVVYERAGSVDPALLGAGAARIAAVCERSLIPYELLSADPGEHQAWLEASVAAVERVLNSCQGPPGFPAAGGA